jgi:hypothetical protein
MMSLSHVILRLFLLLLLALSTTISASNNINIAEAIITKSLIDRLPKRQTVAECGLTKIIMSASDMSTILSIEKDKVGVAQIKLALLDPTDSKKIAEGALIFAMLLNNVVPQWPDRNEYVAEVILNAQEDTKGIIKKSEYIKPVADLNITTTVTIIPLGSGHAMRSILLTIKHINTTNMSNMIDAYRNSRCVTSNP